MKKIIYLVFLLALILGLFYVIKVRDKRKYHRLEDALKQKEQNILNTLLENSLNKDQLNILIVAYKTEDILEIWGKNKDNKEYTLLKEYKIYAKSGQLGPKMKSGDRQVPEGFYHIDRFNPVSKFHLSLGINYPNDADRKRSNAEDLGGDIFIHGGHATIGCLPLTDDKIKEVYIYAHFAKNNGQSKIPVYIFPFKMNAENLKFYTEKYAEKQNLVSFWLNLKEGYDKFDKKKTELPIKIDNEGNYMFD